MWITLIVLLAIAGIAAGVYFGFIKPKQDKKRKEPDYTPSEDAPCSINSRRK